MVLSVCLFIFIYHFPLKRCVLVESSVFFILNIRSKWYNKSFNSFKNKLWIKYVAFPTPSHNSYRTASACFILLYISDWRIGRKRNLFRRVGLTHSWASRSTGARLRLNMQNSAISLLQTDIPPLFPSAETLHEDLSSYKVDRFLCA